MCLTEENHILPGVSRSGSCSVFNLLESMIQNLVKGFKQLGIYRILGECLLIKFTRQGFETLVDIARLAERFNMHSQSQAW